MMVARPESNTVFYAAELLAELRAAVWLRSANDLGLVASGRSS